MTILETAIKQIEEFGDFYNRVIRKMVISNLAPSTQKNYSRTLASMALHFGKIPISVSQDEIDEYLYRLRQSSAGTSFNSFKFAICSLRFAIKTYNLPDYNLILPPVKQNRKLPVVLSRQEITAMMNAPLQFKQRVMIALLYGCGLRCGELRNLKLADVDLDRGVLFIRQSKGKKDRYVPLGKTLISILEKYIRIQKPKVWLFAGKCISSTGCSQYNFAKSLGQRSIQSLIKRSAQMAGVLKTISVHSLRHTYATHLLEDGVNIVTIRKLLGHSHISTTLIYLQVAQVNETSLRSPMDKLNGLHVIGYVQTELSFDA